MSLRCIQPSKGYGNHSGFVSVASLSSGMLSAQINHLQSVRNVAARVVTMSRKRNHIQPALTRTPLVANYRSHSAHCIYCLQRTNHFRGPNPTNQNSFLPIDSDLQSHFSHKVPLYPPQPQRLQDQSMRSKSIHVTCLQCGTIKTTKTERRLRLFERS